MHSEPGAIHAPTGHDGDAAGEETAGSAPACSLSWPTLLLLLLIYICMSYDRGIMAIVQEPVKQEFGLSDAEIGVLSGLAHSGMIALVSLPLGLLIDRTNRRNLLAMLIVCWSITTALGAFARGFWSMLASRMAVGAAEAGGYPLLVSLAADIFPPRWRSTAIGILMAGTPLGMIATLSIGGWITHAFGWKVAFLVAGVPGLLLAGALLLFVREPARATERTGEPTRRHNMGEVLRFIGSQPSMMLTMAGACVASAVMAGFWAWAVSFMVRLHGLSIQESGFGLAIGAGLASALGTAGGGLLADRIGGADGGRRLTLLAAFNLLSLPIGLVALFSGSAMTAFALLALFKLFASSYASVSTALTVSLARPGMRGTTIATLSVLLNIVGVGAGPLLVGVLSDVYGGEDSLRFALATLVMLLALAAVLFYAGRKTIRRDLARAAAD